MSETEFRLTTPRYFYFRQKGFEDARHEQWQIERLCAFYAFLPHAKKGLKPEKLFRLPGEGLLPEFSETEREAMLKHLKRAKGVDVFNGQTIKWEA